MTTNETASAGTPMTDRTLTTSADLDALDFEKGSGMLPVVVQDAASGTVLMMAYANREALEASLKTGEMHFWSRSRGELWRKGETSGNTLAVDGLSADCDSDSILARVVPAGPACHTGEYSCFGAGSAASGSGAASAAGSAGAVFDRLADTIAARAQERPEGSYTTRLLDDRNLRLKKLGEENAELITALATEDTESAVTEAADVFYHVLVALQASGVTLAAVASELESRAG